MYTKPVIYKAYSIVVMVLSVIGFISNLFSVFALNESILSSIPFISDILTVLKVVSVLSAMLSLFFAYVEFSSMYTFAEMIEHEQSNSIYPFRKKGFVLPAKFYKGFGSAIFFITFIVLMIAIIVLTIIASVATGSFITIPLIPVAGCVFSMVLIYITYYSKFKVFGDLLEIVSVKEVTEPMKCSLKENKSGLLRGYCAFLFIIAIISAILMIVLGFILTGTLGLGAFIGFAVLAVICFICLSIVGCYFDNLAKMVEHYMIKYKLYD